MRHLPRLRALPLLLLLALAATGAQGQNQGGQRQGVTELCRDHPRDGAHAGCGTCGGPGWRRPDGRCATWNDIGPPDCRALRGELRDPARCQGRLRERGRPLARNPPRS